MRLKRWATAFPAEYLPEECRCIPVDSWWNREWDTVLYLAEDPLFLYIEALMLTGQSWAVPFPHNPLITSLFRDCPLPHEGGHLSL